MPGYLEENRMRTTSRTTTRTYQQLALCHAMVPAGAALARRGNQAWLLKPSTGATKSNVPGKKNQQEQTRAT
jgi:hypothetical protein